LIIAYLKGLSSDQPIRYKLENNKKYLFGRYELNRKNDGEFNMYEIFDTDVTVSRTHFEVTVDSIGNIKIIDDMSTNGTYLQRESNPIVMIKKSEEIKVFDEDIFILGGLGYKLKLEFNKIICKNCRKEIPEVSVYCPFCGTKRNYKGEADRNSHDVIYSEDDNEEDDDYEDWVKKQKEYIKQSNISTTKTKATNTIKDDLDKHNQENNKKKKQKIINEIECLNCDNVYLNSNSFCLQCGHQNCKKRLYIECSGEDCRIPFRDRFARCPNPRCSIKENPQTRDKTKDGRPPHNMCKEEDREIYLDSGNNLNVFELLMDKYKGEIPQYLQNTTSNKDATIQIIRFKGLNRSQIRDELYREKRIDLDPNGVKHICDNLWKMGLISDVYIEGSDPNDLIGDNRTKVFYIITSDRNRIKKRWKGEEDSLDKKLEKMREKRREWDL
jgi:hypothetical protein